MKMEGNHMSCSRSKKYSCLQCLKYVCNVCSKTGENHSNYNEENKSIGVCNKCLETDKEVKILKQVEVKKKQATLSGFFISKNGSSRKRPLEEVSAAQTSNKKSKPSKPRTVTIETIEKSWCDNLLAKYDARDRRALIQDDPVGTLRETKVFGFRGKYDSHHLLGIHLVARLAIAKLTIDMKRGGSKKQHFGSFCLHHSLILVLVLSRQHDVVWTQLSFKDLEI